MNGLDRALEEQIAELIFTGYTVEIGPRIIFNYKGKHFLSWDLAGGYFQWSVLWTAFIKFLAKLESENV